MPYLQRLDDIDLSKLNIRKMSSIGRKISDNIIGGFMNINHII